MPPFVPPRCVVLPGECDTACSLAGTGECLREQRRRQYEAAMDEARRAATVSGALAGG